MRRQSAHKIEGQGDLFAAPSEPESPKAPACVGGLSEERSLALAREKLDRIDRTVRSAKATGARSAQVLLPVHLALDQALAQLTQTGAAPSGPSPKVDVERRSTPKVESTPLLISKKPITPTEEQAGILGDRGARIIVRAFAGTGKTTTLQAYTERYPKEKFLYIVFNKPAQLDARERFGKNVKVLTSHGLAYPHTGYIYQHKLGNIRAIDLRDEFYCDYEDARDALELLDRFLASSATSIEDALLQYKCDPAIGDLVLSTWKAACDPENRGIKMPHDGYLKLYDLLGSPGLSKYNVVLLDEAQDANPLLISILSKLPSSTRLVAVGDHYQSIYSFRGAVNAMKSPLFNGASAHDLTASWRFGSPVAEAANAVLYELGERSKKLRGLGGPSVLDPGERPEGPYTYLSRTNAQALEHAMALSAGQGTAIHFCGGIDRYRIDRLVDAHKLYSGYAYEIADPEFKKFSTFQELEDYADRIEDVEIQAICATVKQHNDYLPEGIARVRSCAVEHPEDARRILSTAHKAKALEWDQVVLGPFFEWSDYEEDKLLNRGVSPRYAEDLRLLYVAATRAKKALYSNATLREAMHRYLGRSNS